MALATKRKLGAGALIVLVVLAVCALSMPNLLELMVHGERRSLRDPSPTGAVAASTPQPQILLLALDGVDRALLYDLLRAGELPAMASLLGGRTFEGAFPAAHLDETLLSTLPSTTMAAWATVVTGATPAEHGVPGNEFFVRETRTFAAPAPVTFDDPSLTLRVYTDDYANALLDRPTVWERLRARHPGIVVWSSMLPYYEGADALLTARRTVIAAALEAFVAVAADDGAEMRPMFSALDEEAVDTVVEELAESPAPDVLVVYLPGADLYAHHAHEGPDEARRSYLREVVDPALARLYDQLDAHGELADRWVVVTSDHGHTDVVHDDAHALSTDGAGEPASVLEDAGFRVRPFRLEVADDADFQAVLAYQGAMSFVYVADRSTCPAAGDACDWSRPPRFEADVLAAADAFHAASERGAVVPELRGTLDFVLARRPKPFGESDAPFEVYVGGGELVPLEAYLAKHPREAYVAFAERLRDLAVGPHGERAGDVLLLAHNGDRAEPAGRFYFASEYRSWHGSPSKKDSEVPLILARRGRGTSELAALTRDALGDSPHQQKVTDLLLRLEP